MEVELAGLECLDAMLGEVTDDFQFPGMHGLHVGAGARDLQAELRGLLRVVQDFAGVDECLGWHAAAQDAEAAELFGAVDDGDPLPEAGRGARSVEAGAAAADADQVVVGNFSHLPHKLGESRPGATRTVRFKRSDCRAGRRWTDAGRPTARADPDIVADLPAVARNELFGIKPGIVEDNDAAGGDLAQRQVKGMAWRSSPKLPS